MTLIFVTNIEVGKLILDRYKSISKDKFDVTNPPIRKSILDKYGNGDPLRLILLELYDYINQFPLMLQREDDLYFVTRDFDKVKNKETRRFNGKECRYLYLRDLDPIVLHDEYGHVSYRYFLEECELHPNTIQDIAKRYIDSIEQIKSTSPSYALMNNMN